MRANVKLREYYNTYHNQISPIRLMPFPNIDPIIFQIGPLVLRWYALAYMVGLIGGWLYIVRLMRREHLWGGTPPTNAEKISDLLLWVTLGVIIGGRLGYVLFYNFSHYLSHPAEIFIIWRGGMSFHGGLLGVFVAVILFSRKHRISAFSLGDAIALVAPIGLFFGRLANFINSELWGRVTQAPWGIIFPNGGDQPRHPSQLYEAALEGLVLFAILWLIAHRYAGLQKRGLCTGLFLLGYGLARILVEQFRQPDAHIGFLSGGTTMGFWLCVPMLLLGIAFIFVACKKRTGKI